MQKILEKFEEDTAKDVKDQKGELRQFINDMMRIDGLLILLNKSTSKDIDQIKHNLTTIQKGWEVYKDAAKESLKGKKPSATK
jgi:hypothetical protein